MDKVGSMDKDLERLEKLKLEAKENPSKKVKGCTSCKKKKVINESLPPLQEFFIPSVEDIKKAYVMLGDPKEEEKEYIKKVYHSLFNDEFDFNCSSCVHKQTRILKNYIINELKIKI
jgi:hypothetical protein